MDNQNLLAESKHGTNATLIIKHTALVCTVRNNFLKSEQWVIQLEEINQIQAKRNQCQYKKRTKLNGKIKLILKRKHLSF